MTCRAVFSPVMDSQRPPQTCLIADKCKLICTGHLPVFAADQAIRHNSKGSRDDSVLGLTSKGTSVAVRLTVQTPCRRRSVPSRSINAAALTLCRPHQAITRRSRRQRNKTRIRIPTTSFQNLKGARSIRLRSGDRKRGEGRTQPRSVARIQYRNDALLITSRPGT